MMTWWIIGGVGGVIALWIVMSSWRRRRRGSDMGTLSDQWMAEQRLGKDSDPNR
jgi:hypothetical protein